MKRNRVVFLLGLIALLAGLWGGLMRIGITMPQIGQSWSQNHGPLMVSGFIGTLIALERSVAIGLIWTYLAPLSTGIGSLLLIFGFFGTTGKILILLGSLVLTLMLIFLYSRHKSHHFLVMTIGALSWAVGNLIWLITSYVPSAVPWWVGFLLLTIAAERLELRKFFAVSYLPKFLFWMCTLVFVLGLAVIVILPITGIIVIGLGTLGFAIWLLKFDTARNLIYQQGLTRFIASSLLLGYAWLTVSGILTLLYKNVHAGVQYDAILHSFFLGFVFSMIFGHAPIILPSVMGIQIKYSNRFYTHLILLHISVLMRVIGDMALWIPLRQWGGVLSVIAILLFFINSIYSGLKSG